jgi:hypothetical protein
MNVIRTAALLVTGLLTVVGALGILACAGAAIWYGITGAEVFYSAEALFMSSVAVAGFSVVALGAAYEEL